MVLVEGELPVGEIVPVRITGAMPYDLVGTVDTNDPQVIMPDDLTTDGAS